MLYEGAILAVLVVWWFLRDWRATIVAAAALPLSVIPAFLGQYLFGYTLNMVTLLSLALVVGVLVDDAIVEIENISRHLRMGKSPMQAALEAADEIGMAVIATTFSLAAVFFAGSISLVPLLPTGFVPASDRGQTQINVELPPGSTLAETRAVAERVRQAAMQVPHIKTVFSSIGGGSSGDAFAPGAAAE